MMKKVFFTLMACLSLVFTLQAQLIITGVYDGPNSGGTPKGVELYVTQNIADLSMYGISSANNGGGTTAPTPEFVFPAVAATAGDYIYVASEATQFTAFFGFAPDYNAGSTMGINGDDAVELFNGTTVIDVFGDVNTDGTGTAWDYLDGWAYRTTTATAPGGTTFTVGDWTYSGTNQLEGGSTNAACTSPFPIGTYGGGGSGGSGTTVTLGAMKDNTLFESATGDKSNGLGENMIAGRTSTNSGGVKRRGVIKFDVSSIPANATITDVSLKLEMIQTSSGAKMVSLHTLTKDWGEGTSSSSNGVGANSTTGDATWIHTFYNTSNWTTAGGDYTSTSSASTSVNSNGNYTWTGSGLVADVQGWVTSSATNHGWTLIGDESTVKTTKSFATKDHPTASLRPVLEITYTTPPPVVTNPYPLENIGTVNTTDANGIADSLNNKYEVRGVVHSIDFDGNAGYSFSLIDPTGAINVFSFSDVDNYVVTEGDSIHVKGEIAQFNGLTEIVPDSIMVATTGNTLKMPTVVTMLDESTEMDLIRINGVSLVTPSQWSTSGGSFNADITDGVNTYEMRVDSDTDIAGTAAPSGSFDIIGIGSQFDNSNPYNSGYQILPRYLADIIVAPVTNTDVQFSGSTATVAEDTGTVVIDITITNPNMSTASSVDVVLDASSTATDGSDFTYTSPTTVTFPAGSSANQTVSVVVTDDMMQEGSETIVLALTNASSGVSFGADSVMTITITDNDYTITNALILTGVYDVSQNSSPKGYEFYVAQNIPDLSKFGVGAANNGGGTDGQEYTFPAVSATAGDFIYLASDTANFFAFFGIHADFEETGSGTGINGDDAIEVYEDGQVIDIYGDINVDGSGTAWDYLDSWAYRNCSTGPDGTTFVQGNWTVAPVDIFDNQTTNATTPIPMPLGSYLPTCPQVVITVDDVVAVPYNTTVSFDPTVNDNIPGMLINAGINVQPTNGTINLNIITQMVDYTPNNGFCGTDVAEYFLCDVNGCDTATITFNVECPIPAYDIATVVTNDADGNPDSLNVACQLQGIVYGIDFRGGSGYSFTLIDATDGINVFGFNDVPSGYVVNEGDEIRAVGTIGFFNGLTELIVDSIEVISTGNTLKTPTIVTTLGESTESDLIKIEAVTLVDPTQWAMTGSFNVDVRNATDTLVMRIDSDCDISGQPAPTGWFNVTGIGGQFDNSSPYDEGYQIFPRYQADIELISNTNTPANLDGQIRMFPNPTSGFLNIVSEIELTNIRISSVLGQEVMTLQSPNATTAINVSNLTNGVYIITFTTENGTWTEQFVKN